MSRPDHRLLLFFFNDTATTEIYTLSLHDALPISEVPHGLEHPLARLGRDAHRSLHAVEDSGDGALRDRKSTRLNSSHQIISYAVFCLKKKKKTQPMRPRPSSGTRSILTASTMLAP